MRALIVEDDRTIAEFVAQGLREAGFAVDRAADGEEGLAAAVAQPYDVAIIDLMLPKRDGLALIDELRRRGQDVPVLILSARRSVDDRVRGLQAGGDDYLTKPFAFAELLARVQALVRRASRTPEPTTLTFGDLSLDLLARKVTRRETSIELRPREFALLEYLMRNAGKVVSKTMILSHVWDYSFDPQTNIVDVLVSRLRDKVDKPFDTKLIHTVRGVGYVIRWGGTQTFGLRLGLWYATLFVIGAVAIVFLTYLLAASSLAQRDRQIIEQKLTEYASVYSQGGIRALYDLVNYEQRTAPERLFVRVLDRGREIIVFTPEQEWSSARLETVTRTLADGTIVQVAKSADLRLDLLARFRATLGFVTLFIVIVALTGGWLATQSALQPIRRLRTAVTRIIRTGRTDERVPVGTPDDAIGELSVLFNAMLDKIESLVTGMRGALDNVSHDLRTPLTRLRGTAEMALAGPPDDHRYREALADCVEETDRVLSMLNALMDITEAESGTMPLRREPVALSAVVARAMDLYRDVADAKGVALTAESPDGLTITGDAVRLEQVAANLLDNAVKYHPAGGQVRVTLAREGDRALLRVADTGPGIAPDEIPRIWDRLFRGDRSRAERGLGLGLSLVKAIVEAHGGTVNVTSELGRGSTFEASFPTRPFDPFTDVIPG